MTLIWPCPDCQGDLEDEGFSLWCPDCWRPVPYDIMFGPDPDDERDQMIDDRDGTHAS